MSNFNDETMLQVIDEIPTMTEAIRFCVRLSRLTEKQIYLELGIDASNWSRIMNGQSQFPHEKFLDLMTICRNDIPLIWLSKQRGYDLKLTKQSFEDLLQKEREEKEELQKKLDVLIDVMKTANFPNMKL